MSSVRIIGIALLILGLVAPAFAQETDDKDVTIKVGGRPLTYRVRARRAPLLDDEGKPRADFFFVAYEKTGVTNLTKRPVTFVYNGGPGSASLWLHLGGVGPRKVVLDPDGHALGPVGKLAHNPSTWLDLTDLVFLDPVGTGYSRPAEKHEQKSFSGYKEDVESVGDFIRQYVTQHKRWASPKFLAGESYGTMRSAGLSGYLQDRHHMFLDGIVLISTVLDYGTKRFQPGHDLPYALHLPSFTATAWYHKKLSADLQKRPLSQLLREVEEFALGEYLVAMAQGSNLDASGRGTIAKKLAAYTGLRVEFVQNADLRVSLSRFTKELLRDRQRTVGRLDSRFLGRDRDAAGERYEFDPSMANIDGPFSSAINHYLGAELGFTSPLVYESMSRRVRPWSYADFQNRFVSSAETLRKAMTKNPRLRVFVASGYYDLATPYFAADYTFSHLGLPPELRSNLTVAYYESGHMMYIHQPSLLKLKQDVTRFYRTER